MSEREPALEGPLPSRFDEALAQQDRIFQDTFPGALGARIVEVREGYARGELTVDGRVVNPGGVAHGGALAGFGDTVAAWATFPGLREGQMFTTVDFKASFVAAALPGTVLTGEATVVHAGSRTMVLDVRISSPDRLVCVMLVTQAILEAPNASARY